jgi:mannosyltransferase OCH1-like enzyme
MPIPRIIHQTSASKKLSASALRFQKSFALLNQGWELRHYDDDEARKIIEQQLPDFLAAYDSFAYAIQRADMFRVAVVYLFGGVYADLDVKCLSSLEPIVNAKCIFPLEASSTGIIGNYMFASEAHHPFLFAILQKFKTTSTFVVGSDSDILKTTGPNAITELYNTYDNPPIEVIENHTGYCLHPSCRTISCHFGPYACHYHVGTWRTKKSRLLRILKRMYVSVSMMAFRLELTFRR